MKRLISTLIICLLPVWAWGATYYVDGARSDDTGNGTTWALAKKTIRAGVTLLTSNGDTLYIAGGTYTQADGEDIIQANTTTVYASSGSHMDGNSATGTPGTTILDCSATGGTGSVGNGHYRISGAGTLTGMIFSGAKSTSDLQLYMTGNASTAYGNTFRNSSRGVITEGSARTYSVYRNIFEGNITTTSGYPLTVSSGAITTATYNIFRGTVTYPVLRGIYIQSAGSALNFYNNVLENFNADVFTITTTTATQNIRNNIFLSYNIAGSGYLLSVASAATINWSNNTDITTAPFQSLKQMNNTGGATINITAPVIASPQVTNLSRFGYIFLTLDDSESNDSAKWLYDNIYGLRGQKLGNALTYSDISAATHSTVVDFINSGNDIYQHNFSHTDLTTTTAMTITWAAHTIEIAMARTDPADSSTWSGTITVSGQAPISITSTMTLAQLRTALLAQGVTTVTYTTAVSNLAKAVCIASVAAGTSIGSGLTVGWDTTSLNHVEIAEATPLIQTWVRSGSTGAAATYNLRYMVYPNNGKTTATLDLAALSGLYGARYAVGSLTLYNPLNQFLPFNIYYFGDTSFRSRGGGYLGVSNITFSTAKTISIPSVTNLNFGAGDILTVERTTSNNGAYTVVTVSEAGGNTVITVNEALTDESNVSGLLLCENKWKRNAISLALWAESSGKFIEIMSHRSIDDAGSTVGLGISHTEHTWLSSALATMKYANLKTGLNSFLENVWSLGAAPNGNHWSRGVDPSPMDRTIRFDVAFTDQSDYRLKSSSPCKNAGVDVGLTTDFLGKKIRGLPDIGAYEIQPKQTGGSFSLGWWQ
jgi:hypothetical protein